MSMAKPFISFMTAFMICENYEWIEERLLQSINNISYFCDKLNISYEILLCEHIGLTNKKIIGNNFRNIKNVKVFEIDGNYPSPLGYKFIEAYGKNECLKHATGEFSCIVNSDIIFSESFFKFISTELKHKTFYRFADYEVLESDDKDVEKLLNHCENNIIRLCNPGCFKLNPAWSDIGQKSGDIMLLDTKSFQYIKGYPINECHNHVDTSTCIVAMNNFPVIVPPKDVCIYTMAQATLRQGGVDPSIDTYEWNKCLSFLDKMVSNIS